MAHKVMRLFRFVDMVKEHIKELRTPEEQKIRRLVQERIELEDVVASLDAIWDSPVGEDYR